MSNIGLNQSYIGDQVCTRFVKIKRGLSWSGAQDKIRDSGSQTIVLRPPAQSAAGPWDSPAMSPFRSAADVDALS